MAKLKAQACPTCSAPLEVRPDQNQVTCRYCGSGVQIERGAAPKQTGPVNPHVVYIDPNQGRRMARIIGIVGFAPVLVPVFVFLVPWITKKVSHSVKPLPAH